MRVLSSLKELAKLLGNKKKMELIEKDLEKWVKKSKSVTSVDKIPGDASARRYFRVKASEGSFILMKTDPFPEEGDRVLFLEVQRHLEAVGVDVPKVFDTEPSQGYILLEDLGDVTLLRHLQSVGDMEVERDLYKQILDQLAAMQAHAGPKNAKQAIRAFDLSFDYEKLMWEIGHTIEHFYEKHLSRKISAADCKVMDEGFGKICKALADEPRIFVHRDFHSRNIMLHDDRITMIDFQDARMGPLQYDLASLLRDSYYQLEERQIQGLVEYYLDALKREGIEVKDKKHFLHIFDLMCVQRNFKAIGSFASFLNRRSDATYLKYIGNTFENIRRVLLRHPEFSRLREVLFHYYYF